MNYKGPPEPTPPFIVLETTEMIPPTPDEPTKWVPTEEYIYIRADEISELGNESDSNSSAFVSMRNGNTYYITKESYEYLKKKTITPSYLVGPSNE